MVKVKEEEIREIMKCAEDCQAWPVAIKLARILVDNDAANRYADKLAQNQLGHTYPIAERTPERFAKEKQIILATI